MTTIAPPPPQTATPRRAPLTAARVDKDMGKGAVFVDLLSGLVPPCNGASGFLEDAGACSPCDGAAPTQASVFNGHGLFYGLATNAAPGAAEAPPAATMQRDVATRTATAPIGSEDLAGLQSAPVAMPSPAVPVAAGNAPLDPRPPLATQRAAAPVASADRLASPQIVAATLSSELAIAGAVEPDTPAPVSRAARVGRLTRFFDMVGARNGVAVSLQAVDQGQAVVAQVDELDREQRVKLRDRIVALLSRHGLAAHIVRIDGHPGTLAAFEKVR